MTASQPPRSAFRRVVRTLLVHPGTTVLLLVLLVGSYASLPKSNFGGGSTFRQFVRQNLLSRARPTVSRDIPTLYFVREPSGLRTIDPDQESWDELSRIIDGRPQDVSLARYVDGEFHTGFWAATRRLQRAFIRISPMAGDWTLEEQSEIRRLFVESLRNERPVDRAVLTPRGFLSRTVIWSGYAHDAAAFAALVLLIYSLRWIPDSVRRVRDRRRERAVARGLCPACGYEMAGIPGGVCPECGGGGGG